MLLRRSKSVVPRPTARFTSTGNGRGQHIGVIDGISGDRYTMTGHGRLAYGLAVRIRRKPAAAHETQHRDHTAVSV